MGEDVLILGGQHNFERIDSPDFAIVGGNPAKLFVLEMK